MPQLWVRGISSATLQYIAKPLIQELAAICDCGTDQFSIERLAGVSISYQDDAPLFPFVEVKWFDRGQDVQHRFAEVVTRQLNTVGIRDVEIAFVVYQEHRYYINGTVFREE